MEFSRPEYWSEYSLLQGIFPTQGSNPGLPHGKWILYQLSHKGSPDIYILGTKSGSSALQADSLPSESQGKPHIMKGIWKKKIIESTCCKSEANTTLQVNSTSLRNKFTFKKINHHNHQFWLTLEIENAMVWRADQQTGL